MCAIDLFIVLLYLIKQIYLIDFNKKLSVRFLHSFSQTLVISSGTLQLFAFLLNQYKVGNFYAEFRVQISTSPTTVNDRPTL